MGKKHMLIARPNDEHALVSRSPTVPLAVDRVPLVRPRLAPWEAPCNGCCRLIKLLAPHCMARKLEREQDGSCKKSRLFLEYIIASGPNETCYWSPFPLNTLPGSPGLIPAVLLHTYLPIHHYYHYCTYHC